MRMGELYRLAVEEAMKVDPRRGAELESVLRRTKKAYEGLGPKEKRMFDRDTLWNPYADSRILYGDPEKEITSVMWGIDIHPAEALIADRLREKGKRIDALFGHHPRGRAQAGLYKVMPLQENMMESWGVPITAAECIMGPRMNEVMCSTHAMNHQETVDACRLLDVPFMCLHQPCDLLGQDFMNRYLKERAPDRLGDLVEALTDLPEYEAAAADCNPPEIYVGSPDRRVGKVAVKFAGGTAAPKEMYEHLARSGIGTVVGMHVPESHIEEARKHHVNIVIASHMASDSLGTNLLADKFEELGLGIIPCSGYIRVKRN